MNLYLAPIQGMTIAPYRNSYQKYFGNIDAYYAPFIATSEAKKVNQSILKDLLPENNNELVKIVPQLLGNDGEHFKNHAEVIYNMGFNEINWNIGCPFPMVTNKQRGSGILPHAHLIQNFLDIACSNVSYSISVKMRLGLNSPEEGIRVIDVLNQYPLKEVIIHARTGKQMYKGNVDLDAFQHLSSQCKHPITYNGDIFTLSDFLKTSSRFPSINNFMLGRGALIDPFLPSSIRGHTIPSDTKTKLILQFHNDILNYYKDRLSGEKHLCDRMKEFWFYLHTNFDNSGKLYKKIKKCNSISEYKNIINQLDI